MKILPISKDSDESRSKVSVFSGFSSLSLADLSSVHLSCDAGK
jgi:hypothetical protein